MATPYLGQIIIFAGNFAIRGFAQCDGAVLSIAQNTAVFSLLGTTYGGNGTSTFALPDLRGRVPLHYGQGAGLTNRSLGDKAGTESETLNVAQIPAHAHTAATTVKGSSGAANAGSASGNVPAGTGRSNIYQTGTPDVNLNAGAATTVNANTGGGGSHNNMPPYLALNFQIALEGLFPPRT